MTKKDYEMIAEVFARHRKRYGGRTDSVAVEIIDDMAQALKEDSTRFDILKFRAVCGLVTDEYPCERCGGVRDVEARICNSC